MCPKENELQSLVWLAWHAGRGHLVTLGRPYDAPVGTVLRCHCGDRRKIF